MLRRPAVHAVQVVRVGLRQGSVFCNGRRAVTSWVFSEDSRHSSGASSLALAAALATAGAVYGTSSPAQADSRLAEEDARIDELCGRASIGDSEGLTSSSFALPYRTSDCLDDCLDTVVGVDFLSWKPFGIPSAGNDPPARNPGDALGRGNGAGGKAGGPHADPSVGPSGGDDESNSDGKLDLRRSAEIVRAGLKEFRANRAAKGVSCPAIDFRQEQDSVLAPSGSGTLSASFFLPRSANVVRLLSTMVSPDQVLEVQPMLGKPGAAIGFCDKDRTGSLLVRQSPSGPHGSGGSVHVYRDGGFTRRDLDTLMKGYQEAWSNVRGQDDFYRFVIAPAETAPPAQAQGTPSTPRRGPGVPVQGDKIAAGTERLRQLGVEVHDKTSGETPGWDSLAGYADVKQEIEDTLVMPLKHPEAFDNIARKTRARFESNRPRAVLFEGPPGTGKTLSARIIAGRSDQPMVHVPVEGIMSKWYGESEKKLSAIFDACDEMGGAIIFIDEVDALAGSRDKGDMHEATRRILSVILQKVEGFEGGSKSTLICATNRKSDLDAALLSRFQLSIRFGLPNAETRKEIFGLYAKQLSREDLATLASVSNGMSCRDIKETCQHAERRWASKVVRGHEKGELPTVEEYVFCLDKRSKEGAWRSRPTQA